LHNSEILNMKLVHF